MKILITGGHVTPALAVIDELKEQEIVFVGRKYAVSSEEIPSFEYQEIIKREVKFIDLQAGKFTRVFSLRTLLNLLKIPKGFIKAYKILKQERPDKILTFGGYIALPIAFWGYFFNIPVYTHEQTSVPGASNRLIGKFAKKIFVSFPQTAAYFPKNRVVISGNPIRKLKSGQKLYNLDEGLPTIFISGGSLGSHSVNRHLKRILFRLLPKYNVIHQTGAVKGKDDFESLIQLKNSLPEELKARYFPKEHFFDEEYDFVIKASDLVVGRSGANIFFELVALKKPAVLIPLPWSSAGEQQRQAKIFNESGCGEIFDQGVTSELLLQKIEKVASNIENYKRNFKNLNQLYHEDAAEYIVKEILKTK